MTDDEISIQVPGLPCWGVDAGARGAVLDWCVDDPHRLEAFTRELAMIGASNDGLPTEYWRLWQGVIATPNQLCRALGQAAKGMGE